MKSLFLIIILILTSNLSAMSLNFDLTPLQINFIGIEAKGDTVIAWGDHGSMLISYDNGNIWEQISLFESHQILKIFWNDEEVIALNSVGQFAKSIDKFLSWEIVEDIQTNILAVIQYPHGYFIRSPEKVMTIGNDFKIKNEFDILSPTLFSHFKFEYRKSLAFYNEQLIVAIDSCKFIRYNNDLLIVDTLSFPILFETVNYSQFEIDVDSDSFFACCGNSVYKTTDFESIEKVLSTNLSGFHKVINNRVYYISYVTVVGYYGSFTLFEALDSESLKIISRENSIKYSIAHFIPDDFIIHNDNLITVGRGKLIAKMPLNDTICFIESFYDGFSVPDKVNDSTYLFYSESRDGNYFGRIYSTTNKGTTFNPTYNSKHKHGVGDYNFQIISFKYYDTLTNKLYLFIRDKTYDNIQGIYVSEDYGQTGIFYDNIEKPYVSYSLQKSFSNIQYKDEKIITTSFSIWQNVAYCDIRVLDSNFDPYYYKLDTNFIVRYFHYIDTNNYTFFGLDRLEYLYEIKTTENGGNTWNNIKKYGENEIFVHYKELFFHEKKLVALFYFDNVDSTMSIDILDTESLEVRKIHDYRLKKEYNWFSDLNLNAITCNGENFYIAIEDTLFRTSDIYDRNKWEYDLLPTGSRIYRVFEKFDSTFISMFSYEKGTPGMYWLNPNASPSSVEDFQTEDMNYLYSYPAYPMPASNEVRTLVYWDLSFDTEKYDIAVYDLLGNKVSDAPSIRIEPHTAFSGNVIWNCSGVEPGIYLMRIKHGTEAKTIKVMVQR